MGFSSRGGNAAASVLSGKNSPICLNCRLSRLYSAAAAPAATTTTTTIAEANHLKPTSADPNPPVTVSRKAQYRLKAGLILTRAPVLTRTLTPFENAFFFYQKRLNERLVLPFRHELYFKRDTPQLLDYKIKFDERSKLTAKELGRYWPQGRNAWNDELMVGSTLSTEERMRDILLKDAEYRVTEDGEKAKPEEIVPVERPQPRLTEADAKNDVTSLDRALERTLYLVVKRSEGVWEFPSDVMMSDEALHETAQRVLESTGGINMNTFLVGRVPVAHHVTQPQYGENSELLSRGQKTFFIKARILAGQANISKNPFGYQEFNWLTREELQERFVIKNKAKMVDGEVAKKDSKKDGKKDGKKGGIEDAEEHDQGDDRYWRAVRKTLADR